MSSSYQTPPTSDNFVQTAENVQTESVLVEVGEDSDMDQATASYSEKALALADSKDSNWGAPQ